MIIDIIFCEPIFWICITDGLIGLKDLFVWTPQIFAKGQDWFYGSNKNIICKILAIGDIFFRIQNSLWHIILAYNFLHLLRLKPLENLSKHQKYHWCIVIIVRLIFIFPMVT